MEWRRCLAGENSDGGGILLHWAEEGREGVVEGADGGKWRKQE
jgi:hypothetical protein